MGFFGYGNGGYGYGRGGGFHLTWIIGAAIALFGVVRYFTHTQTNPVTGQAERVAMSPEQEVQLGLHVAPQMAQKMGGEVPESRDPRARLVEQMGQKLVSRIDAPNMPWRFDFHLLNDPQTVNAFALPGGQVFITTALFDKLDDEAELAGVLGHEIGHVIYRHSAKQQAQQQLGQSFVTAVGVGASGDQRGRGQMAIIAAQFADQMMQLHYSRSDESEADSWGVRLMTKAGYDPHEMIRVMDLLKKVSGGGRQPEFMSTHPAPGNRAELIKKQIAEEFPTLPPGLSKGRPLDEAVRSVGGGRSTPPPLPGNSGNRGGRPGANDDRW